MSLTADYVNRIIDSTASITDIVTFHEALRALEASDTGMLYPTIHTYKALDLGGGAFMYGVDFVNSWRLRFPTAGSYTIIGNINATVIAVAGVFVDRTKALAFTTTSVGGSGGGTTAALTDQQAQWLQELAMIHGLVQGVPLVVSGTRRTAGSVVQTIAEASGTVTMARLP